MNDTKAVIADKIVAFVVKSCQSVLLTEYYGFEIQSGFMMIHDIFASSRTSKTGLLVVDLDAVLGNYRLMKKRVAPSVCAAVVKANAYGVGMEGVVSALWQSGCQDFCVGTLDEAQTILTLTHPLVPRIFVLYQRSIDDLREIMAHPGLIPVINTKSMLIEAHIFASLHNRSITAAIHFDTGMSRLGLDHLETEWLIEHRQQFPLINMAWVLSHYACADIPDHPMNAAQATKIQSIQNHFPGARLSMANSSGIFLSSQFWGDMVRPGAALYGVNPHPGHDNPLFPAITLMAKILQIRQTEPGQSIGYGASFQSGKPRRIATLGVGYADGLPRSLGNCGFAYVENYRVPMVGRISMDLITLDVTDIPEAILEQTGWVELIGSHQSIDTFGTIAKTSAYEILTSLSHRYERILRSSAIDFDRDADSSNKTMLTHQPSVMVNP